MAKDYYKILGIDKKASKDEIKKAFRTLAHKYHPDKKGGDGEKFKEINEAYTVLADEKRRAEYDAYGQTFAGAGGFGQGFGGFDFSQFTGQNGFGGIEFDIGDIFGDFFGGRDEHRKRRGRDISIDIEIDFRDSVFGAVRKILIGKTNVCDRCKGDGGEPGTERTTCSNCNGKGKINETRQSFFGTFTTVTTCTECRGSGTVPEQKCAKCKGHGVMKTQEEITVSIPPGITDGEMIRMPGKGEAVAAGIAGDLYVKIHVRPHQIFHKEGANLVMDLKVKLSDALLGTVYPIETLDGKIEVKIPEGVSPNQILRVKGKGVPVGKDAATSLSTSRRGDLLIKLHIQIPEKLSRNAKELFKKLREEGI